MGDEFPRFKAAVAQATPVFLDREATVAKACRLIEEAGDKGAKLIVFPETWIPTFPFWALSKVWYVTTPEERNLARTSRRLFVDLYRNSVEIPSPSTEALCRAAKKAGIFVIMGLNEREYRFPGTLYNTLLYIDNQGQILGKHRKLVPTFTERTIWGQGDGSTLKVFDTEIGRLGGLICFEHQMTLVKYAMFAKGEQVHAATWPSGIGYYTDYASRQYAIEGQVFVIVACSYMTREQVPDDFPLKDHTNWDLNGGSCIISPLGQYIAGPVVGREETIIAEIDLSRIIEAKQSLDTIGHYARPDVARLVLDESHLDPMEVVGGQHSTSRRGANEAHLDSRLWPPQSSQGDAKEMLATIGEMKKVLQAMETRLESGLQLLSPDGDALEKADRREHGQERAAAIAYEGQRNPSNRQ